MQVHKRVRLAIRLDEVQRIQTKEKAEQSWRQRAADEVPLSNSLHSQFPSFAIPFMCNFLHLQLPSFQIPFICNTLRLQFPSCAIPFMCNSFHFLFFLHVHFPQFAMPFMHCMVYQFRNWCCLSKHKTMHQSHMLPRQTCHRSHPFYHAVARKTFSYQQLLRPEHASVTDHNNSTRWRHHAKV